MKNTFSDILFSLFFQGTFCYGSQSNDSLKTFLTARFDINHLSKFINNLFTEIQT